MTSSSPPEESMKALMDAVAQVTNLPSIYCPHPAASALTGAANTNVITAMGGPSTSISMSGMIATGQGGGPLRKRNHDSMLANGSVNATAATATEKARAKADAAEIKRLKRLEHNRMAAIESRRRKKHMVEELQRSVQFYTKANSNLKSQNADLERQLLIAKQKILTSSSNKAGETEKVHAPASSVKVSPPSPSKTQCVPNMSSTSTKVVSQPAMQRTKKPPTSHMFGNLSSAEMEKQAQQAQYAATQALYKTMGYPAGAARVAASTFSQFVGQTGIVPGLNDVSNKTSSLPKQECMTPSPVMSASPLALDKSSSSPECDQYTSYIEALNKFAMQQAAAANAAAAAATAAIQAAHLHKQLKDNASSSPDTKAPLPSLPLFTFPPAAGMTSWPFQIPQATVIKRED